MPYRWCQKVWPRVSQGPAQGATTTAVFTACCTLHTAHCTLHTANCTLRTSHCTLHTAHKASQSGPGPGVTALHKVPVGFKGKISSKHSHVSWPLIHTHIVSDTLTVYTHGKFSWSTLNVSSKLLRPRTTNLVSLGH